MSKLYQKLAHIQSQLKSIPETGRNAFHGYSYASVEDVLNAVRPVCSEHGIFISINCVSHEILKDGRAASVVVQLTLTDIESGESVTSQCPGYSEDSKSDKSLWKAISGASKYVIRTFFTLASGDDPEQEDAQEREPSKATASPTPASAANGKAHKPVISNSAPAPRPQSPRSSEPLNTPAVNSLQRQGQAVPASPHSDNEQASMITATTHEMVRLNWSTARGRLFLQEHFGKSTRRELTPHELYQFLEHLRSQPTVAREPVPS